MKSLDDLIITVEPNPKLSDILWHVDVSPLIGKQVQLVMVGGHTIEGRVTKIHEAPFDVCTEAGGAVKLRWPHSLVLDHDNYTYYAMNTLEKIIILSDQSRRTV